MLELELEMTLQPLVLMVEDRKETREDQTSELIQRGCKVITASNADDALKCYMGLPKLDLIFSDIDLLGWESKRDKSGVDIAKFIKQLDNELPVIGYSSKFKDDELSEEEKSYFDGWYSKGGMHIHEMNRMFDNLSATARNHRSRRYEDFKEILQDLVRKKFLKEDDLKEAVEIATAVGSNPMSVLDEELINQEIHLLLIRNRDQELLKKTLLVWLTKGDDIFEIEVYGHSELYSYGNSESDAINNLINIMYSYYSDSISENDHSFAGPAIKITKFLKYLFD